MTSYRTILFADVVGSTRIYDSLGNAAAHALISASLTTMRVVVEAHKGTVVKTIGDEVMAVFPSALCAVAAACEMNINFDSQGGQNGAGTIKIRAGIHSGEVIERDGDFFGDAVNVAAKITSYAKRGQILISSDTANGLPRSITLSSCFFDHICISGKPGSIRILEIEWLGDDDVDKTIVTSPNFSRGDSGARRAHAAGMALVYLGRSVVLDSSSEPVSFGRAGGGTFSIIINDPMVSRNHATIERHKDKFRLSDQSRNGTFVVFDGSDPIAVRQETMVLHDRGYICFGSPKADGIRTVEFFCG